MKTNRETSENGTRFPWNRILKIAGVALLVVLLLTVCIVGLGIMYVNSKLDLINYSQPDNVWPSVSFSDIGDYDDGLASDSDTTEIVLPSEDVFKDKDVMNILLLGTDERVENLSESARADSMMILSLNTKTNGVKLVSLERGVRVRLPNGKTDILGHAFRFGGPEWVISCVQSHFNLDVEKYIRVNFNVFEKIVDAVGGVDIELTRREADAMNHRIETNTIWLDEVVTEGWNHLDGFAALQYCRLRYIDSDWQRIVRQRKTIAAIQKECVDMSFEELNDLADLVLPMVHTNLSKGEVFSLMLNLPQFLDSEIEDMTIPAKGTFWDLKSVDFVANSEILHDFLYDEE